MSARAFARRCLLLVVCACAALDRPLPLMGRASAADGLLMVVCIMRHSRTPLNSARGGSEAEREAKREVERESHDD